MSLPLQSNPIHTTLPTPQTTTRDDLNISRHGSVLGFASVFSMSRPQVEADEWERQQVDMSGHSAQSAGSGGGDRGSDRGGGWGRGGRRSPSPQVGNSPRSAPAAVPSHLRPGPAPPR